MSHAAEYEKCLDELLGLVGEIGNLAANGFVRRTNWKLHDLWQEAKSMKETGFYVPYCELIGHEDYAQSRCELFSDIENAKLALNAAKPGKCDLLRDVVMRSILKAKGDLEKAFPEYNFTVGESVWPDCSVMASATELRNMALYKLFENAVLHGEPGNVVCDYDDQAAWVSPGMHIVTVTNRTTRRIFPAKIDAIFNRENPAPEVVMYGHNLIDVRNTVERYRGILLADSGASPGGRAFRVSFALPPYRG